MSESKFTPGNWIVATPAAIDWRDPQIIGADGKSVVAITHGGGPLRAIGAGEQRANASLIASAPALLEACQWALGTIRGNTYGLTPEEREQALELAAKECEEAIELALPQAKEPSR